MQWLAAIRAHLAAGRLEEAARLGRQAVSDRPDNAHALHLLGGIRHLQGDTQAATALLRQAVERDGNIPKFHNDLGIALCAAGRPEEAVAVYARALTLRPDFAQAHNNLGTALDELGRGDDAVVCYRRALAVYPDYPDALCNLANSLRDRGDWTEAEALYRRALTLDPGFASGWSHFALLFLMAGEGAGALQAIGHALAQDKSEANRTLFVRILRAWPQLAPAAETHLVQALQHDWCRPEDLAPAILTLLRSRHGDDWPALFEDPLFHNLLAATPLCDLDLEKRLTLARREMLDSVIRGEGRDAQSLAFHVALARQSFLNDYIYPVSPDEEGRLCLLDRSMAEIVVQAAYRPLHRLDDAQSLLQYHWPPPVAALLTQQIVEPLREEELRARIPVLAPVEDPVSRKVRDQYETHPYPRWARTLAPGAPTSLMTYLRNRLPGASILPHHVRQVLVAGCGTGRLAIEWAQRLAEARVLAIDLSLASLAYARRRSEEIGLITVDYAQADLLRLTEGAFDFISAGGVLHHLGDPLAGWRALQARLVPGGLMQIGLYSALARRHLSPARVLAGPADSDSAIRQARQMLIAGADAALLDRLKRTPDFYSLSECRDLLFHVQERDFTLPEIADFLASTDMVFIGFDLDEQVRTQFRRRFPHGRLDDLVLWDRFEQDNPDSFAGMYQFWVQKRP